MIGKNEEVHKETEIFLREILLKYQFEVISKKSQEDVQKYVPKALGIPSLGDKPKHDELREQIAQQVDLDALRDVGVEDIEDKEVDVSQKEIDVGEGTQNPLVVTIDLKEEEKRQWKQRRKKRKQKANLRRFQWQETM